MVGPARLDGLEGGFEPATLHSSNSMFPDASVFQVIAAVANDEVLTTWAGRQHGNAAVLAVASVATLAGARVASVVIAARRIGVAWVAETFVDILALRFAVASKAAIARACEPPSVFAARRIGVARETHVLAVQAVTGEAIIACAHEPSVVIAARRIGVAWVAEALIDIVALGLAVAVETVTADARGEALNLGCTVGRKVQPLQARATADAVVAERVFGATSGCSLHTGAVRAPAGWFDAPPLPVCASESLGDAVRQ
jgi:hypothetical protein